MNSKDDGKKMKRGLYCLLFAVLCIPGRGAAGPPFITDDPQPVELHHFETFYFSAGSTARDGYGGAAGIDFNYGAAKDLHINIVAPYAYDHPRGGTDAGGLGNIELAAKYRFLHQDRSGWDVAVYPRLILGSASRKVGDPGAALFLPVWIGRAGQGWSTYGGGGCLYRHQAGATTACQTGWVVTRDLGDRLHVGAEIVHQSAAEKGARASTALGAGLTFDLNDHYHLLAYAGPNLQNVSQTARYNWYAALQTTF